MKEDLLHFVWLYRKYPVAGLKTTTGESIFVKTTGTHNRLSGPDFFNSKLELDGQLWAGNVEIHIKSSDWYAHNHQVDANYDNVILHVVWDDDVSVFRKDGSQIPTLALRHYIAQEVLATYQQLFDARNYKFINCEKEINQVDEFIRGNWLDRLFVERLEQKSIYIDELLKLTHNDWEHVLFLMLLKNFGSKINGELFLEIGKSIDFSIVRKLHGKPIEMESLFMGQAGFLNDMLEADEYHQNLKKEYSFLKHKYELRSLYGSPEFFKLRPFNFPTIRLSQLAMVYAANTNLFHVLIENNSSDLSEIFSLGTSEYWETHYTFGKTSKKTSKRLSKSFLDLIMINTIVPLKFCYKRYKGSLDNETLFKTMSFIKMEQNRIVENFRKLNIPISGAKESQGYLQLYNEYCTKDKCLHCAIGAHLMNIKV
ncbi:DUF2851 family protein [Maribacter sp. X9]|uniref:DUF2851 family protein n=1 Tax=Maribacter sp. X9 TaxID=3402159 RepID=UPI003AF3CAE5